MLILKKKDGLWAVLLFLWYGVHPCSLGHSLIPWGSTSHRLYPQNLDLESSSKTSYIVTAGTTSEAAPFKGVWKCWFGELSSHWMKLAFVHFIWNQNEQPCVSTPVIKGSFHKGARTVFNSGSWLMKYAGNVTDMRCQPDRR